MNNQELDQLYLKNKQRQAKLEDKYNEENSNILTAKQIMQQQQDTFEIKERFKDASINYPTYGRGLKQPGIELNTFMIKQDMCTDVAKEHKKKERQASGSGSPKADVQAQQRKRILSPKRQRYESEFEKYVEKKLVHSKLEEQPPPDMNFDTTTKPTGSINQKVVKRMKYEKELKKKQKEDQLLKSLPTLEKEAIEILQEEVTVIMGKNMLDKLKEIFESSKEKDSNDDAVETAELIGYIAEDSYFEKNMEQIVRENVDG